MGNLRLPALHGVVPRGYISWTTKDQNEGVLLSRVEIQGRVVHSGAVEGLVERTVRSCFTSHGGSCACHNERMRCRRPSLAVCLHFFKTSILGVVPLRFLVPGLPSEARRHHSRGVDTFVGKKKLTGFCGPTPFLPTGKCFYNFLDKLPVLCLEFQIMYYQITGYWLPVFIFLVFIR